MYKKIIFIMCFHFLLSELLSAQELPEVMLAEFEFKEEEVISASRHKQKIWESPLAVTVITAEDIRRLGITNLVDIFRSVVGIDVMSADNNEVDIVPRGLLTFGSAKVLLLVNGQRLNQDFVGTIVWNELPILIEDIERIEIIRGPGSPLYGANAYAGVIHIITKNPLKYSDSNFKITIGEKETYQYSLSHSGHTGKLGYRFSGGWFQTEGWGNRRQELITEDVLQPPKVNAKIKDWSALFRSNSQLTYSFAERRLLTLTGGITMGESSVPYIPDKEKDSFSKVTNRYGKLTFSTNFPLNSEFMASVSSTYRKVYKANEGIQHPFESTSLEYSGEIQYTLSLPYNNLLIAGGNAERVFCSSFRTNIKRTPLILSNAAKDTIPLDTRKDELIAGYIQGEFRSIRGLIVTGGTRYDKHYDLAEVWSPRVSAVYTPIDGHTFRTAVGRAFRKPSFMENYYNVAITAERSGKGIALTGTKSKPEKIITSEVAYRYQWRKHFIGSISYFQSDVKDLIFWITMVDSVVGDKTYKSVLYGNWLDEKIKGYELELETNPSQFVRCFFNFSYQDVFDKNTKKRINMVPIRKGNIGFDAFIDDKFLIGLVGHYVGTVRRGGDAERDSLGYFRTVEDVEFPAYKTVDIHLGITQKMEKWWLTFGLSVTNLFDKEHVEYPLWNSSVPEWKSWNALQKERYLNRNALNDRKLLATLQMAF